MVVVSPQLYTKYVNSYGIIHRLSRELEEDEEVNELLRMSNVMAVSRLKYNDHGIVHAKIVAGTALELLNLLTLRNVELTTLKDGITRSIDEVMVIVFLASYLHDIGNSVHRVNHEFLGALLAKDIVDRVIRKVMNLPNRRLIAIRQEILHAIFSSEYEVECLTTESSIVKLADGLDMSEGRARVPYKLGKFDMHAVSALSIKRVEVEAGERPIKISVYMDDVAGLFQIENVLMPKILSGLIKDHIEIYVITQQKTFKYYPKD